MNIPALSLLDWVLVSSIVVISLISALRSFAKNKHKDTVTNTLAMVAYTFSALALIGIVVRPEYITDEEQSVILHLPDALPKSQLENGWDTGWAASEHVSLGLNANYPNADIVSSIDGLLQNYPNLRSLTLNGVDIDSEELQKLSGLAVQGTHAKIDKGIHNLTWSKQVTYGQNLHISGSFQFSDDSISTLVLKDLNDSEIASIILKPNEAFDFNVVPKAMGPVVYYLKDESDTTLATIRTFVTEGVNFDVYFWASSPNTEFNALKNWLLQNEHDVATEFDISVERSIIQKSNQQQSLDTSAVVVMDARKLSRISDPELQKLRGQIGAGQGLIILADSSALDNEWLAGLGFDVRQRIQDPDKVYSVRIDEYLFESAIDVRNFGFASSQQGTPLILDNDNNQVLASGLRVGLGTVVVTFIDNTFLLQRQEQKTAYSRYWQTLLSFATSLNNESRFLEVAPEVLPEVGKRIKVCALVANSELRADVTVADVSRPLPLTSTPHRPTLSCGYFWPDRSGWHQLKLYNASSELVKESAIYVHNVNELVTTKGLELQHWLEQQKENQQDELNLTMTQNDYYKKVPLLWFALLWLLSSGFLWWKGR